MSFEYDDMTLVERLCIQQTDPDISPRTVTSNAILDVQRIATGLTCEDTLGAKCDYYSTRKSNLSKASTRPVLSPCFFPSPVLILIGGFHRRMRCTSGFKREATSMDAY